MKRTSDLLVLATQAAVAVENARLYDETERKGRELQRLQILEERERIGKELHDGVIQSLFAVGMHLQALATASGEGETERRLTSAVEDIDRAIRDLRNYIFGLRPGILATASSMRRSRSSRAISASRTGVVTVVDVDPEVASALSSLAPDVVQLVRESLSNVGRHAVATTCRVSLRRDGSDLVLEIDDDGQGFDVERATSGMGLRNLRERVGTLVGSLQVDQCPGRRGDGQSHVPGLTGPDGARTFGPSPIHPLGILGACSLDISSSCRSRRSDVEHALSQEPSPVAPGSRRGRESPGRCPPRRDGVRREAASQEDRRGRARAAVRTVDPSVFPLRWVPRGPVGPVPLAGCRPRGGAHRTWTNPARDERPIRSTVRNARPCGRSRRPLEGCGGDTQGLPRSGRSCDHEPAGCIGRPEVRRARRRRRPTRD